MNAASTFLTKTILAGLSTAFFWFFAAKFGLEPRVLDGFILFLVEYTGVTIIFSKKGW